MRRQARSAGHSSTTVCRSERTSGNARAYPGGMQCNPYATVDRFLDHWQGVRLITIKTLRAFSLDDLEYRLVPDWRTVGELFHHIAAHQYYVARGVLLGVWDPRPGDVDADWTAHRAEVCHSTEALESWLAESQSSLEDWTEQAGPNRLERIAEDNPWHEGIRGWLILHHAYQDELHHRGQLYAIARLLGRTPPAVYAEEHDEFWLPRKGR